MQGSGEKMTANKGTLIVIGIIIFWMWKKGWFKPNRFL